MLAIPMVVAGLALMPSSAGAYSHQWNCNWGIAPYNHCYDWTGTVYNPWTVAGAAFGSAGISYYTGLCVKAVTAAGSIKSASDCFAAWSGGINLAASPDSHAYYYFGQTGTSTNNSGGATT